MRQGFIIAAIILWVGINIIGSIGDMQPMLSTVDTKITNSDYPSGMTEQQVLDQLTKPEIKDAAVTFIGRVGGYLTTAGKIFTLYHPSLWQGSAIYLYYFLILPIGISFWVVIVFMIRGVGSS